MAWLPRKAGLMLCARKHIGGKNELWRMSYPGMEISLINEGLSSYVDLSIALDGETAVASQATRISDVWVGPSAEPRVLKKITQATDTFCWTPEGRLVYLSTAGGNSDLWIMRADGAEQRQLTNDPADEGAPVATSDGRYIVFVSNRTGTLQVWRMDADGGNQVRITDGEGKNYPTVSPDGKWVLYNTNECYLWKVPIDGGEPIRVTRYIAYRPCVSPDGKLIACIGRAQSKPELLIAPFEGGEPLKRFDVAAWDSRVQWTNDGKAVIYATRRDGVRTILKQSLDGSPPKRMADFDDDWLFDFGYSFDGQLLGVTRGGFQHDIVLISDLNRY